MPGGAWVWGSKKGQAYPLMSHLVERGWVCVAMSYRLSPRNTWPAQIVDVAKGRPSPEIRQRKKNDEHRA